MGRVLQSIEKGLKITGVNSDAGVSALFGASVPGGDADVQDAAGLYVRVIYHAVGGSLSRKAVMNLKMSKKL